MNRSLRQIGLMAPRGFAKSTLAVLFILHHIIYDPGDKVIIIISKTQEEAKNRLNKIKNILDYSRAFIDLYGYGGKEVAATWTDKKIKSMLNGSNFTIKSIGMGMPARGTIESGLERLPDGSYDIGEDTRITLLYGDDTEDEDNTKTIDAMNYNWNKFKGIKEGMDERTGRVIVVGTPIHEKCMIEKIKELNETGWFFKEYEAHDDNFKNLLWPEYRSEQWLRNKYAEYDKDGDLRKYYMEFRCSVIPGEKQKFKPKDNRYYEGSLIKHEGDNFLKITEINNEKYPEPVLIPVNVFTGVDPASSQESTADFSVIFNVAYDGERIFCLPYIRDRIDPYDLCQTISNNFDDVGSHITGIETTGFQKSIKSYLRELRRDKKSMPVREYKPREKKLGDGGRLESLVPLFREHKVYLLKDMEELKNELLMYPRPRYDDLMDGLWFSVQRLIAPSHMWQEDPEYTDDQLMYINGHRKLKFVKGWLAA